MFSRQFLAYFTDEEQDSTLVKMVAAIGDNVELALQQQYTKDLEQATELIAFPESRLRSWLSFLMVDIPNVKASEGSVTVELPASAVAPVSLNAGVVLTSESGSAFVSQTPLYLQPGQSGSIRVVQGTTSVFTGVYNTIIEIPASGVDLSRVTVMLGDRDISRCKVTAGYVEPIDGYHAFVYGGTLYIKVFRGSRTPYPEGMNYSVVAWGCDGLSGNVTVNSINGFEDTVKDINGNDVDGIVLRNDAFTNGADAPTRLELIQLLRNWFFVKSSVSSIPEYTAWFRQQPEVGDVIVEGDYERWLRDRSGSLAITGSVYVTGLDKNGNPLDTSVKSMLTQRIEPYKDIGLLAWENPVMVKSYIEVNFVSCTDVEGFVSSVKSVIQNFYNLMWLLNNDMSLFEDVDFERVRAEIGSSFGQVGLEIVPYHYYEDGDVNGTSWTNPADTIYVGESLDGHYLVYEYEADGVTVKAEPYAKFVQYPQPDGTAEIYVEYDRSGGTPDGTYLGVSDQGVVTISGFVFLQHSNLRAFWNIADTGTLPVGRTYGYRALGGYSINQVV